MRHRPIGIGVQGLADAFQMLRIPFDSPEAKKLNRDIFETIYFGACTASCALAKEEGPYETYEGCPASKGQLQSIATLKPISWKSVSVRLNMCDDLNNYMGDGA